MFIKDYLKDNLIFLDGGMGTLLQENGLKAGELPERWNVTHADVITKIHKEYFDAGSNVVATNTFGANILKFSEEELEDLSSVPLKTLKTQKSSLMETKKNGLR